MRRGCDGEESLGWGWKEGTKLLQPRNNIRSGQRDMIIIVGLKLWRSKLWRTSIQNMFGGEIVGELSNYICIWQSKIW